jgi:hypothetical protein
MLERAANQVQNKAVNTLRDSLDVALGSGSAAESTMTWRRGEQDLQQPFALPYGYRTPEGSLPSLALRTLTSLWRCKRCVVQAKKLARVATRLYFALFWMLQASIATLLLASRNCSCLRQASLWQRSGELLCSRRTMAVTFSSPKAQRTRGAAATQV